MLTENLNPFFFSFLLFDTGYIPTCKSIWMQLQSQIKWYQKHGSFKILDLCRRLFNLSPAVCDNNNNNIDICLSSPLGFYISERLCILKFNPHEIFDILNGIIDTGTLIREL